tara:strand:- start:152 stop:457 length:306 start_codon:yes stop_codon:yes gene_type:complete
MEHQKMGKIKLIKELLKPSSGTKNNEIDFVITDLEVRLLSPHHFESFISLRFIDTKPNFPRIKKTLDDIGSHPEANIIDHSYSYKEIKEDTKLDGLYFTKH